LHLSNFLENEILDHILGTGAYTSPTVWGSLHSDSPGETGANELTGGSYARQTIAFAVAAAGTASNSAQEEWDLTGVTAGDVTHIGLFDAVSAGNFLWSVPLGGDSDTFTAADTGDLFTSYGHGRSTNDRVELGTAPGSALPTGVSEDTVYWIIGAAADTFQLSLTMGGGAIALTSDGEGIAFFLDVKAFNSGDTFRVAANDLDVFID
jgi:hypothetical protein